MVLRKCIVFLVVVLLFVSFVFVSADPPHKDKPSKNDVKPVNPNKGRGHVKDKSVLFLVGLGSGVFVNSSVVYPLPSGGWGDWSNWWNVFNVLPDEPMIGE